MHAMTAQLNGGKESQQKRKMVCSSQNAMCLCAVDICRRQRCCGAVSEECMG